MVFSISVVILSFCLIVTAYASNCSNIICDDVHFFLARGTNEPYPGRQGDLVAATCNGLSSCGYEDLVYSSLNSDLACQSLYDGAIAGHIQMAAYASACPNSKLILSGFSKGAAIITSILGGGGGPSFNGCEEPATPAMDRTTKPGSQIAAAIAFGNDRHTADQSYNFGNGSAIDGLFPRTPSQLAALNSYADVLLDWCLADDPICAANQPDSLVEGHLSYFLLYCDEAASWIKSIASLTDDSSFSTTISTSVSGTVQGNAAVATDMPSSVILDTTWTEHTSVVPCTGSEAASQISSSSITSESSTSKATSISTVSSKSSVMTTALATLILQTPTQTSPSAVATSSSSGVAGSLDSSILFTMSIVVIVSIYT